MINYFRPFIFGLHFTVFNDHASLQYTINIEENYLFGIRQDILCWQSLTEASRLFNLNENVLYYNNS